MKRVTITVDHTQQPNAQKVNFVDLKLEEVPYRIPLKMKSWSHCS